MHDEFWAVFLLCLGLPIIAIWWAAHRHIHQPMSISEATRLAFKNYWRNRGK